jgi:hypothetical protein
MITLYYISNAVIWVKRELGAICQRQSQQKGGRQQRKKVQSQGEHENDAKNEIAARASWAS